MGRTKAETVELNVDGDRVVAAIAYAIHISNRQSRTPTQYDIVKSLFLADRSHLNRYGRLITNDSYVAMEHGPVPSVAYGLLKGAKSVKRRVGYDALPWKSEKGEGRKIYFFDADTSSVDEYLSPSDKTAIEDAIATLRGLSFGQIRRLTHEDAAYIDAWEDSADVKRFPISLGLLFDTPNYEKARELSNMSKL